jgi:hypothetical protein
MEAYFTLKNARKHLLNLKQMIEGGGYFELDSVAFYPHPTKRGVLRQDVPNPLKYIAPEVGTIASESRAVLDQLVFAALTVRLGHEPTNKPQFPICEKPEDFLSRVKPDLKGFPNEDIAFIEQLQPYKGHSWMLQLRDIANPHKHRKNSFLRATEGAVVWAHAPRPNADAKDIFVLPSGMRVPKAMQMNARMRGKITLENGAPVIETLEVIQAEIGALLDVFKQRFSLV